VSVAIVVTTLRQRFTSPLRLILLLMLGWTPMLAIVVLPQTGFAPLTDCYFLALVLAAGMIGQDISSGTLQLALARPLTRARYVFSKWLAVSVGTVFVVMLQVGVAALIMALRQVPVAWDEAALVLGNGVLLACGTAAVMALFSALLPGLGDLGLLFLVFFSGQVMGGVGAMKSWPALVRASDELQRVLKPQLELVFVTQGGPVPWFDVVSYLSTVTLCLALAVMVMNRRELSYASN